MGNVRLEDFVRRLSPLTPDPLWGIWLYIIFFLVLITLFRQKIPNTGVSVMLVASLLFCIIDKVAVGTLGGFGRRDLGTFFLRAAMFILPIIAVGVSRNPKSRVWGVLAFFAGGSYFLARGIVDFGLIVGGPFAN